MAGIQMRQLMVVALPGGWEVALYWDQQSPQWTSPDRWHFQEGRVSSWCVRLPLSNAGIRLVVEKLAAAC